MFNRIFRIFIVLCLFFYLKTQDLKTFAMDLNQNNEVIEELRLNVPSELKDVWLRAEQEVWEPWLSRQEGFLGRQILYNKNKSEALLLVSWQNKKLWKDIPSSEVEKIQSIFEENVKQSLNLNSNPFELVYEGELYKEK